MNSRWTPENFPINLTMFIILAGVEKSRLTNVFQAFAMNIYESLLTCLQKSDGFIWFVLYGGVVESIRKTGTDYHDNGKRSYSGRKLVLTTLHVL